MRKPVLFRKIGEIIKYLKHIAWEKYWNISRELGRKKKFGGVNSLEIWKIINFLRNQKVYKESFKNSKE